MNATGRLTCCGLLSVLAAGCAGLDLTGAEGKAVTEKLEQRNEEVVRDFANKRDAAEFQAALAQFNQGDVAGCEQQLRQLLERNPDHRDALLLAVEICLDDNRTAEAFRHAEHALQAHPDDAYVAYTMGFLLDATEQESDATAYYRRAAELDPDNELFTVAHLTALETAEQAPAERISDPSSHSSPSAGDKHAESAGYATAVSSTPAPSTLVAPPTERAENNSRSSLVDSTEPARTSLQRARRELERGSPEAAAFFFRQAIAAGANDPQIPISAGVTALRHNQPALAVDLLLSARRRFPHVAELDRVLGTAYYRLGDYQSSQLALQQALSLDKSSGLSYFLMGCTLAKLGQQEAARTHWKQARMLNPRYGLRR